MFTPICMPWQGDGFSFAQMHDYAERLRTELLRVKGVNKVDFIGDQEQRIYIEISNAQLAKLGLTPQQISDAIGAQNNVAAAGVFTTADDRVYVHPSGQFQSVEQLADTLIRVNNRVVRLGDIAKVKRGYTDPPTEFMRFNNQNVLGIGVTMTPSGDVIALGKSLDAEAKHLQQQLPSGLKLVQVSSMPHAVAKSVDDFVEAVAEAIAIVLVVSLISLGFRTGHGGGAFHSTRAGCHGLVHVSVQYRLAQGIARYADSGAGFAGGRCDYRGRDDGGEAGTRLRPHACRCICLHQHGVPHADRHAGHRIGLFADRAGAIGHR